MVRQGRSVSGLSDGKLVAGLKRTNQRIGSLEDIRDSFWFQM
jgi:hypothetical protein